MNSIKITHAFGARKTVGRFCETAGWRLTQTPYSPAIRTFCPVPTDVGNA